MSRRFPVPLALIALLLVGASAIAEEVEFRFDPPGNPSAVFLAGDFNNWNPSGRAMSDPDGDGVFTAVVDLPPGRYQYKFVVGSDWYEDPAATQSTPDGFGGKNSVIVVGGSDVDAGFVGGVSNAPGAPAKAKGAVPAGAVEFTWKPDKSYGQVFLAGELNSWSTSATPMTNDGGTWKAKLDLAPGRYAYKFVADGSWFEDPNAAESVDDGYGGKNSVIVVGDGGTGAAAKAPEKPAAAAATGAVPAGNVEFAWKPDKSYGQVFLAGEFNNWSTTANPMTNDGGTWKTSLDLSPGRYAYKFVADGNWFEDPDSGEYVDDGYGGKNSVIEVGEGGAKAPAASPQGAAEPAGEAQEVRFAYTPLISGISTCYLVGEFNGWNQTATPMTDEDGDGTWETTVRLAPGKYAYKFLVDGTTWLEDPNATDSVDDGYGGQNSVIHVGASGKAAGPGKPRRVTFEYRPSTPPKELSLAGTFNNWTVGKTLMTDPDGDGVYSVTLLLPEDTYQYKFVADGNWITDNKAKSFQDDGFGGKNSVVVVDDSFPGIELATGDGKIFTEGIEHRQTPGELNRVSDTELDLTVRTYQNDVQHVEVAWKASGGGEKGLVELEPQGTDATFQYWRGSIVVPGGVPDLRYGILYEDGGTVLAGLPGGFVPAADELDPGEMFAYSEDLFPRFTTPDWVRDGVIYQIFPDRFANGDPSNDPDFSEPYYKGRTTLPSGGKTNDEYYHLVKDWYDVGGLARSPYRTDGKPDWYSFYGGDIAGVRQNLDYLQDLGVTILYFNPLFPARSNHKYDAIDYHAIDPHFATVDEFKAFVQEAHDRGIRIVADWVINHIGDASPYFQDTVKKGPDSQYWTWFEWKKWPLPAIAPSDWREYYECWWGFGQMPDLNYDLSRPAAAENAVTDVSQAEVNWPVVNYILDSARWWLGELDIDGFRLDVPNEVPFWVWKIFREEVRKVKPDTYLVGEIWSDAGDWVSPECFDATMNYKYFCDPVMDFIGKGRIDAARFDRALSAGRMAYPVQATRVMMNLVDSHDKPRFLTATGGDVRRLKLAALVAMTYVGAPHVYYGDEIAMRGAADPDCRRPFDWKWKDDAERAATHEWYHTLAGLRRDHPALVTGEFRTLVAEGPVYAYARRDGSDTFVVAMNVSDREAEVAVPLAALGGLADGVVLRDMAGGGLGDVTVAGGELALKLAPISGTVLGIPAAN